MSNKIITIIPARGGSKGIPRKNVRLLAGKPLVAWTIEAALGANALDRVIVSTEDGEIAKISEQYGAEVIIRPKELALDITPIEPVLEYTVAWLKEKENYRPDLIVLLQPTSPLRDANHIDGAMENYLKSNCDTLLSVCPSHAFLWRGSKHGVNPLNYDYKNRPRKQDKEQEYRENGAIYITKYEILMKQHNRLGGRIELYVMSEEYSIDIDTEFDFWLCEKILDLRGLKHE